MNVSETGEVGSQNCRLRVHPREFIPTRHELEVHRTAGFHLIHSNADFAARCSTVEGEKSFWGSQTVYTLGSSMRHTDQGLICSIVLRQDVISGLTGPQTSISSS